jgi:hypothetical protein
MDIGDLGAEIGITLGREGEKHTFNTAAVAYIKTGVSGSNPAPPTAKPRISHYHTEKTLASLLPHLHALLICDCDRSNHAVKQPNCSSSPN